MQFTQRIIDFDRLKNSGVEQEPIKSFVLVVHHLKLKTAKMAGVQSRFLPATQNTIESLKKLPKIRKKLKKAHLERSDIVKVTGLRNLQSFDAYQEADEQEQRHLSWAFFSGEMINQQH